MPRNCTGKGRSARRAAGWLAVATCVCAAPSQMRAQPQAWVAEGTAGYATIVDDAFPRYWAVGGSLRRRITERVSAGPEVVVMGARQQFRDRLIVVTGNLVLDLLDRRSSPFVVAGAGIFGGRERFPSGAFWASDPAFTVGAGFRVRAGEGLSAGGEYRLGWELHHRVSAFVAAAW